MGVNTAAKIANLEAAALEITIRLAAADSQGIEEYEINGRRVKYADDLARLQAIEELLAKLNSTKHAVNLVNFKRR